MGALNNEPSNEGMKELYSKCRLIHEFWIKWILTYALLSTDPIVKFTIITPRFGLHLLLNHVLVTCTLCHSWENTHVEDMFDDIASHSMYNWDIHHVFLVSSLIGFVMRCACLNCAKKSLKCSVHFG